MTTCSYASYLQLYFQLYRSASSPSLLSRNSTSIRSTCLKSRPSLTSATPTAPPAAWTSPSRSSCSSSIWYSSSSCRSTAIRQTSVPPPPAQIPQLLLQVQTQEGLRFRA